MIKLLLILSSLTVATLPVGLVIQNTKVIENKQYKINDLVTDSYNKIVELLNNQERDFDTLVSAYITTPDVIYEITGEEMYYKYTSIVDQLESWILSLNLTESQKDLIMEIQEKYEFAKEMWLQKTDVYETLNYLNDSIESEKDSVSKMYYAYNQVSSKKMTEDLKKYQPIRIQNIKAKAELPSIINQIQLKNQEINSIQGAKQMQEMVSNVFQGFIDHAEELRSKFANKGFFDFIDANKLNSYFKEKADKYLGKLVEKLMKKAEIGDDLWGKIYKKSFDKLKNEIINRAFAEDAAIPGWISTAIEKLKGGSAKSYLPDPSAPPKEDQLTNDDFVNMSLDEIYKDVDNEIGTLDSESKLDKYLDKAASVTKEIYALDDIMFGNLKKATAEFRDYVQSYIPTLSDAVKKAFESNGVHVVSDLEKKLDEIKSTAETVMGNIFEVIGGDNKIAKFTQLAFGAIDEIESWAKTFDVLRTSKEAINQIKITQQQVTAWPGDVPSDPDQALKDIETLKKQQKNDEKIIEETNKELLNSKYETYSHKLNEWNKLLGQYTDFVDVDNNVIENKDSRMNVNLNPVKYFKRELKSYTKNYEERLLYFNKLISIPDIENILGDKLDVIKNSIKKLNDIKTIIDDHKGDFENE